MKKLPLILMVVLFLVPTLGALALAQDGDAVLGKWTVAGGKAIIEIYKCKDKYCGKIIGLREPKNPDGTDKLDVNNPDESKRTRPLMGLVLLWGLKYVGDNKYEDGGIYAADTGKTYNSKMTLKGDQLDVRGFMGISLLGRTDTWTRVQ
ncbi:MAG: DUF2147 domain-containing protein [Thermodesulfobacteriota bacterium]